jgi:hypothetical protein
MSMHVTNVFYISLIFLYMAKLEHEFKIPFINVVTPTMLYMTFNIRYFFSTRDTNACHEAIYDLI